MYRALKTARLTNEIKHHINLVRKWQKKVKPTSPPAIKTIGISLSPVMMRPCDASGLVTKAFDNRERKCSCFLPRLWLICFEDTSQLLI